MNIKLTDKDRVRITNPEDIFSIMQRILLRENKIDREKEHFWIVGLNSGGVLLYIELVSMGSVKGTVVEPMNVFRVAILKGATRVIAVHNHPSGITEVSLDDEECTDRLIQVGRIIDIAVEDHIIISTTGFLSMKQSGLMAELASSRKYVPTYKLVNTVRENERALRAEAEQRHRQEIVHYRTTAIANLIVRDVRAEEIADILNIDVAEVKEQMKNIPPK